MTNYTDSLFVKIKDGLKGINIGISTGLPKLDEIIAGVQKATLYDIAAGLGVGKTSLALYAFIYYPLKTYLNNPNFKIIYFSLEMTAEILLAKLLSLHIYDTYNIEVSYKKLMSRTKNNRLSEEEFKIVANCELWLHQVEQSLIIYDKALTSDGLYAFLKQYSTDNGNWISGEKGETYVANNPDCLTLVVLDHMGLLKKKVGQSMKDAIDTTSSELIYFRNKCSYSALMLQQLNRTASSMDRRKAELQETELQDLKDSGGPSEAADVVLSLFFPHREKMVTYRGFKIAKGFREAFRSIVVLKNRYGECDSIVPLNFFGSIGLFKELDEPSQYEMLTDYSPHIYLFPKVKTTLTDPFQDDTNDVDFNF